MRLIGTLQSENDARRLAAYLQREGIDNSCDAAFDAQTGSMSYQLWALDEDRVIEAQTIFSKYMERPSNAAFDTPITEQLTESEEPELREQLDRRPRPKTFFTTFVIALCTLIFFLNWIEIVSMRQEGLTEQEVEVSFTPVEKTLLFDLPPTGDLNRVFFWRGAYTWVLLKIKGQDVAKGEGPLFAAIRQGEVWRLISPAVLHRELLHILFNMIWVWMLCRPIESRIGIFRTLLLSLCCGIGSNVAQYLMSGPFFLGYSGVVMGLAGFTWMREKIAPWEGYPLNRSTIRFLLLFVGGMFLLQLSSFVLQMVSSLHFEPNIANTAHIVGALLGAALGRLSFFSMRVLR